MSLFRIHKHPVVVVVVLILFIFNLNLEIVRAGKHSANKEIDLSTNNNDNLDNDKNELTDDNEDDDDDNLDEPEGQSRFAWLMPLLSNIGIGLATNVAVDAIASAANPEPTVAPEVPQVQQQPVQQQPQTSGGQCQIPSYQYQDQQSVYANPYYQSSYNYNPYDTNMNYLSDYNYQTQMSFPQMTYYNGLPGYI